MSTQPPAYSDAQLKTLAVLTRNNMAVTMFWFMLVVFSIILVAMFASVFWVKTSGWVPISFTLLDGVIGWSIKYIVAYLFSSQDSEK